MKMMQRQNLVLSGTIFLLSVTIVTFYTPGKAITVKPVTSVAVAVLIPVVAAMSASCLWVTMPRGKNRQASNLVLYGVATLLTAFTLVLAFSPIILNLLIYHDLRVYVAAIVHLRNSFF